MKKLALLLAALLLSVAASAQEFVVKSFEAKLTDMTAKVNPVLDLNGNPCALIRVQIACKGCRIEGNLGNVGTPKADPGEYLVYVPAGTQRLKISHPDYLPLTYEFNLKIEGNRTYELRIMLPQNTTLIPELHTSFLVLTVSPQQAVVFVDDLVQSLSEGVLSKELPYGQHTYRVEAPMYHPRRGTFIVSEAGNTQLSVALDPAFGFLAVNSTPAGARVFVDGREVGTTPYNKRDRLPSGSYQVQVLKEGYYPQMQTVEVADNRTATLSFPLKANFATITLQAANPEAEIWVSGKRCGTGNWSGRLDAGTYSVESRCEGYEKALQSITVEAGVPQTIRLQAQTPIYGILKVNSTPVGATVTLDGKAIGTTPLISNRVLVGTYRIEVSKADRVSFAKTVQIIRGQAADVTATLKPVAVAGSVGSSATPTSGTRYKVGDYYNENGKEGVVFEVDATGRSGKIMALRDLPEKMEWGLKGVDTEATDENDGMKNMRQIQQISGWKGRSPVFAGCAALGEDWYLPAKNELKQLYDYRERLSLTATSHGGTVLKSEIYWSSTEYYSDGAWHISFWNGNIYKMTKLGVYCVRPIAAFGRSVSESVPSKTVASASTATSTPSATSARTTTSTSGTRYEVGDYYNKNGKEGVVFEVDATGRFGKIMALRDLPEKMKWGPGNIATGTIYQYDGCENMQQIQQNPGWKGLFPAFAGCAALGGGWYLPAKNELKQLYDNREKLSQTASSYSGTVLTGEFYWSSSNSNEGSGYAWGMNLGSGYMGSSIKSREYRVRPIAAFGCSVSDVAYDEVKSYTGRFYSVSSSRGWKQYRVGNRIGLLSGRGVDIFPGGLPYKEIDWWIAGGIGYNSLVRVVNEYGLSGYIDLAGNIVVPCKFKGDHWWGIRGKTKEYLAEYAEKYPEKMAEHKAAAKRLMNELVFSTEEIKILKELSVLPLL